MARRYVMKNRSRAQNGAFDPAVDYGPAERWQHGDYVLVSPVGEGEGGGALVVRALEECALDRWLEAGRITPDEHEAGMRLRRDHRDGRVAQHVCHVYDGVIPVRSGKSWASPAERRSEAAEAAYQRWRAALRAVGPKASPLLIAVCCEDLALNRDDQRLLLKHALQDLVRHYRL